MVALRDGASVQVNIGGGADDPRLVITDLLPHLGAEQNKKPLAEAIPAETLNLLLGSEPIGAGGKGNGHRPGSQHDRRLRP